MFARYRTKRAIRQARKGIAMIDGLMVSLHMDRAARRRLWAEIHAGRKSVSDLIGKG